MAENCKSCRYWWEARNASTGEETGMGYCRRRAPSSPAYDAAMASLWPRTCSHYQCGEHEFPRHLRPKPSCRTCRWSVGSGTYCHRRAPIAHAGRMRTFPALEPGDFCGDYEPADSEGGTEPPWIARCTSCAYWKPFQNCTIGLKMGRETCGDYERANDE